MEMSDREQRLWGTDTHKGKTYCEQTYVGHLWVSINDCNRPYHSRNLHVVLLAKNSGDVCYILTGGNQDSHRAQIRYSNVPLHKQ